MKLTRGGFDLADLAKRKQNTKIMKPNEWQRNEVIISETEENEKQDMKCDPNLIAVSVVLFASLDCFTSPQTIHSESYMDIHYTVLS